MCARRDVTECAVQQGKYEQLMKKEKIRILEVEKTCCKYYFSSDILSCFI